MKLKMLAIVVLMFVAQIKSAEDRVDMITRTIKNLKDAALMISNLEEQVSVTIKSFVIDGPLYRLRLKGLSNYKEQVQAIKKYLREGNIIAFGYWDQLHSIERKIDGQLALANSEGDALVRWEKWLQSSK